MRVIAGAFGGRTLRAPAGDATRPTSDRVREALFSMLGALDGARVLDLYAGTGALGIEALSRGAAAAVFVERDPRAVKVLRANLEVLGLGRDRAEVRPGDAGQALRNARTGGEAYDLVLLDPPYKLAPALGPELGDDLQSLLTPGARVVAESDRRAPLELALPRTHLRRYGDTVIAIHSA